MNERDEDMTPEEFDAAMAAGEPVEIDTSNMRFVLHSSWPLNPIPQTWAGCTRNTANLMWDRRRGFVPVAQTSSNWRGK